LLPPRFFFAKRAKALGDKSPVRIAALRWVNGRRRVSPDRERTGRRSRRAAKNGESTKASSFVSNPPKTRLIGKQTSQRSKTVGPGAAVAAAQAHDNAGLQKNWRGWIRAVGGRAPCVTPDFAASPSRGQRQHHVSSHARPPRKAWPRPTAPMNTFPFHDYHAVGLRRSFDGVPYWLAAFPFVAGIKIVEPPEGSGGICLTQSGIVLQRTGAPLPSNGPQLCSTARRLVWEIAAHPH